MRKYVGMDTLFVVSLTHAYQASDNDWVRITSADGYSFIVRRKIAKASGTMKSMLDTASKSTRSLPPIR